jgi:hypothetical protein
MGFLILSLVSREKIEGLFIDYTEAKVVLLRGLFSN